MLEIMVTVQETLQAPALSKLEQQFETINNQLRYEGFDHAVTSELSTLQQRKYFIGHMNEAGITAVRDVKKRLLNLGAEQLSLAITQDDYYYLEPGANPSFQTETISLRVEKSMKDYHDSDIRAEGGQERFTIIYKENSHVGDPSGRRARSLVTRDDDANYQLIEAMQQSLGAQFDEHKVSKVRTYYELTLPDGAKVGVNVDEAVNLSGQYPIGNVVEIMSENQDDIVAAKDILGIKGEVFNVPYINKDDFEIKIQTEAPAVLLESPGQESGWREYKDYRPYYYDASTGSFVVGLDPDALKTLDTRHRQLIIHEFRAIHQAFDSGKTPASRRGAMYEHFPKVDGFKHRPNIASYFRQSQTWRKMFTSVNKGRRILFSVVEFHGGSHGVFLHDITDHDTDYRAWLDRHAKR